MFYRKRKPQKFFQIHYPHYSRNHKNQKYILISKNNPILTLNPNVGGSNPSGPVFVFFCVFVLVSAPFTLHSLYLHLLQSIPVFIPSIFISLCNKYD